MTLQELRDDVFSKLSILTKEDVFDIFTESVPSYIQYVTESMYTTDFNGAKTASIDITGFTPTQAKVDALEALGWAVTVA